MKKVFTKKLTNTQIKNLQSILELANEHFDYEYNKSVDKILNNYDELEFDNIRYSNKELLVKIINKFISIFPEFKQYPCSIYLHGSYSRLSFELYSDIDITLFYDSKYEDVFLPLEELLNNILIKCFNLGDRVKVHSFMMHLIELYDPIVCDEYVFDFGKFLTLYNFNEIDKDIYRTLYCAKDKDSFYKYINDKSEFIPNEYCFNFEKIYDNNYISPAIEEIELLKENNKDINKLNLHINNHIKLLKENLSYTLNGKGFNIKEYKTYIKINPLHQLYKTLSVVKKFLNYNNIRFIGLNVDILKENKLFEYLDKKICLKLKRVITHYLWCISKIRNLFKLENINFSTKNNVQLNDNELKKMYNNKYKDSYKRILKIRKKLYNLEIEVLKNIIRRTQCMI